MDPRADRTTGQHPDTRRSHYDFYERVFHAAPVVSFLTDPSSVIVDASDAAASFLNVGRHALRAKPLLHFVARGDTRIFREHVTRPLGDGIGPFVAALRPRQEKPCVMTLTARRVSRHPLFVWIALPAPREPPPLAPRVVPDGTLVHRR
jgi:hypothetical protein